MGLPARKRLHLRREFERVFARGKRFASEKCVLYYLETTESCTRYGIVVGKRNGNAVTRNRLKRRVREVLRKVDGRLPEGLHVIVAPRRFPPRMTYTEVEEHVLKVLRRARLLS